MWKDDLLFPSAATKRVILRAELFRSMAGIKVTFITYKGAPQIMTGLLGGEVHFYLAGIRAE